MTHSKLTHKQKFLLFPLIAQIRMFQNFQNMTELSRGIVHMHYAGEIGKRNFISYAQAHHSH